MQSFLISFAVSFVLLIVMLTILKVMERAQIRPVDRLADVFKPATPAQMAATGTGT